MTCEKCGFKMFIDTWNGWVWTCWNCDHIGPKATDEEIKQLEKLLGDE